MHESTGEERFGESVHLRDSYKLFLRILYYYEGKVPVGGSP